MSTAGAFGLGLALFGFGIPAWIFAIGVYSAAKKWRPEEPGIRYFAYARVMDRLLDELKGETKRAPVLVATIRELRNFSEYRDISILFLEEVNVTGDKKFDRVLERELKETEANLLDHADALTAAMPAAGSALAGCKSWARFAAKGGDVVVTIASWCYRRVEGAA